MTSPTSKIKKVTTTTCITNPIIWLSDENSNSPSITNVESTTIAILIKLILIRSVASSRFGAATSLSIFSSVVLPEVFNSSISVGVSEKKADSAAETNDTITNNTSIESIENTIPADNGLTIILRRGDE